MAIPGLDQIGDFFTSGGLSGAVEPIARQSFPDIAQLAFGVSAPPVQPQLPGYQSTLTNKYADPGIQQFLSTLPPQVANAVIQFDAQRVSTGAAPLTREQTMNVGTVAANRQVPTEGRTNEHWWNVPGNAISDLKAIVASVPRLADPRVWIRELAAIPNMGKYIADAQQAGMNPISAIASAPGVRMIPGSFIAQNITNPRQLISHPLFTGLDLLPVAETVARGSGVVRAAELAAARADTTATAFAREEAIARAAQLEERAALMRTQKAIAAEAAQPPNALRTVISSRLDSSGNIVPTRFATAVDRLGQETALGRLVNQTVGYRDVWQVRSELENRLSTVMTGKIAPQTEAERALQTAYQEVIGKSETLGLDAAARDSLTQRWVNRRVDDEFTPDEQSLAASIDRANQLYVKASRGELVAIDNEIYPRDTAALITDARDLAAHKARAGKFAAEARISSRTLTVDDFTTAIDAALNQPPTATARIKQELEAITHAMDAYGYDTSAAKSLIHKAAHDKSGYYGDAADALHSALTTSPATRAQLPEILQVLDRHLARRPRDAKVQALRDAIAYQDPNAITRNLNSLRNRQLARPEFLDDADFLTSLTSYRDRARFDRRVGRQFTDKAIARADTAAAKLVAANPPARFSDVIRNTALERAKGQLVVMGVDAEKLSSITDHVLAADWDAADRVMNWPPGTIQSLYTGIRDDIARNWQRLADEGYDPLFIHRVSRAKGSQVLSPRLGPIPNEISAYRERVADFSPQVSDYAVSVSHQGIESVLRDMNQQWLDYIAERHGIRQSELQARYRQFYDPTSPYNVHQQIQDIIGQQYRRLDMTTMKGNWGGVNLDKYAQDQIWIPRALADSLDRLMVPKSQAWTMFDKATKTFRLAVVGLSPRTQLYNVLGNSVMAMGEVGPGVLSRMGEAREMVLDPSLITNETIRAQLGSMSRDLLDADLARVHAASSYLHGKTAFRMAKEAIESGGTKFRDMAEFSMKLNGMVDDMYRVAVYLTERDKALTRGLGEVAADVAGERAVNRAMMNWMAASPIERDVLKSIFPFYGFMRHSLRYVLRYPVDHPMRAAFLGAFGRAEEDDLNGLPLSHLAMVPMPFTGTSSSGTRTHLSLGALNPFADVANMFTVAGWLGATNPVISTILESVGVDSTGQAELYPTFHFDPETGRLAATHDNILMSFATNTIPQSQILLTALGWNKDFNERVRRDPSGAMRSLISAGGLPVLARPVNIPQEFFKVELARERGVDAVKNSALATGDWSQASSYPSLSTILQQLQSATREQLAPVTPKSQSEVEAMIRDAMTNPFSPVTYPGKSTNTPLLSGF